jgi:transcriptional antiterminator NusG
MTEEHNEVEMTEVAEEAAPVEVNPDMKWYVVHTYSGYENRAQLGLMERVKREGLEHMFGEILVPTESVVEMKGGSKRTTSRKFFPGYIIVQMEMTDETWHLVKDTDKITGFVGGTRRRPSPVPEREVLRITQQMEEGTTKPKPKQDFQEGETVRVTDGPFMNFTGTVEEVRPDKQKLRVLVSIFGRATPVELDFMQVESV